MNSAFFLKINYSSFRHISDGNLVADASFANCFIFVSHLETKCFSGGNNLFLGRKQLVSSNDVIMKLPINQLFMTIKHRF